MATRQLTHRRRFCDFLQRLTPFKREPSHLRRAFDRGQQTLFLGNRWMAVPPIAARILMTLLDHPGTIVPASTLLQAGWQGEPRGPADLSKQIRTRRVFWKPVPTSRTIWSRAAAWDAYYKTSAKLPRGRSR